MIICLSIGFLCGGKRIEKWKLSVISVHTEKLFGFQEQQQSGSCEFNALILELISY